MSLIVGISPKKHPSNWQWSEGTALPVCMDWRRSFYRFGAMPALSIVEGPLRGRRGWAARLLLSAGKHLQEGEKMNTAPITATELQEILRLHALWLTLDPSGKRADLQGANLVRADFQGANLVRANLQEANLREANLLGANLVRANLLGANLREANLLGANLRGANLQGADLRGANLILLGQDVRGYLFYASKNEDDVIVICAGCREFTGISAAKSYWQNRHTDDEVLHEDCLSLIDRCERMARVRGWKLEPVPVTEEPV